MQQLPSFRKAALRRDTLLRRAMRIHIRCVGRHGFSLDCDDGDVGVAELRARVAATASWSASTTKLVSSGKVLADGERVQLSDGALVLALAAPPAVVSRAQPALEAELLPDDQPVGTRLDALNLHPVLRNVAHKLVSFGAPESVVAVLCAPATLRRLLLFAAWCMMSKTAARYDVGPPFILFSILAAVIVNLGVRQPGSLSAYSLFNPGVQSLPGTTSAEEFDAQVRNGLR